MTMLWGFLAPRDRLVVRVEKEKREGKKKRRNAAIKPFYGENLFGDGGTETTRLH